jgi:hypothetical protein
MTMKRILAFAFLLLASPALAQTVTQSGSVTRNHIPYWVTSGVIGDAGSATDSPISGIGITNEGGPAFCVSSQRASAAGRQQLCFLISTAGGATVSLTNLGTAPTAPLSFVVDGISYPFPGSLSQLIVNTTPVVGGNTGNCLFVNGTVVGQQSCAASSITQLTGDVTAIGPGSVPATLATVNGNVGTFGSAAVVPLVTVNAKGLITAISNATIAIPGTQLTGTTLAANILTSSLTTVGTIGTGVWQGSIVGPTFGGTGVNNGSNSITLAASVTTTGTTAPTFAFPSVGPLTYTFQNASDTIVMRTTTDTLTNKTLTSPTINAGALSGTFSGTPAFSGANFLTLANQAQIAAATLIGNPTAGTANQTAFTVQSGVDITTPNTSLDWIPIFNHTTGTIQKVNASELTSAVGSGVTSIAGNSGVFTLDSGITNTVNRIQADGNYTGNALANCSLAASVSANLLTVALKDNAGNDPTTTSPCYINYRNVTASTGSTTLVSQTAALSISTNATGASLGAPNNSAFRFWVVSFNNAGTNVLALINCVVTSPSTNIFPLNESVVASSTPISGSATSGGVFYTPNGTTVTSKAFRIIGYVEYNATGLVTAGTYATGPNFIQVFGPGIRRPGEVVQVAYNFTNTPTSNTTATPSNTNLTQAITPTSAANLVKAAYGGIHSNSANTMAAVTRLLRGATVVGGAYWQGPTALGYVGMTPAYDRPNSIASTTYTVQVLADGTGTAIFATSTANSAAPNAQITVEEIMG